MSEPEFTFTMPAGWEELSPDAGRAIRKVGNTNSVLRMSFDRNPMPRPLSNPPRKAELAANLVKMQGGTVTNSSEGQFALGSYGRAIFTGKRLSHGEAWVLTDGTHLFLATYASEKAPDRQELQDVTDIITSVRWQK